MSSLNKRKKIIPSKSLTLALNTVEGRLQLALGLPEAAGGASTAGVELIAAQDWSARSQGVELFIPALQDMLKRLALTPEHIGRIAVVNGPGSFTGLRLSTVSAAALSRALGVPQAPLAYMPLLAGAALPFMLSGMPTEPAPPYSQQSPEMANPKETTLVQAAVDVFARKKVWVLTHARRGLIYCQGFSLKAGVPQNAPAETEYYVCPASSAQSSYYLQAQDKVRVLEGTVAAQLIAVSLQEAGAEAVVLGSGLHNNAEFFAPLAGLKSCTLLPAVFNHPAADALLGATSHLTFTMEDIAPLYLRGSDAEDNLEYIAAKLGLDPTQAREKLTYLLTRTPSSHI